jgi:hypothetical protein
MRRTASLAACTGLAVTTALIAAPQASATSDPSPGSPAVVATGLDNPRQLNWDRRPGNRLVVAEAGAGGESCLGEGEQQLCVGLTGAVSVIDDPRSVRDGRVHRVLEGLLSAAGPDGSFAAGPAGADVSGHYVYAAQTYVEVDDRPPGLADLEGLDQLGHLLGAEVGEGGVDLLADLAAFEQANNPDGAQVESNPYAALVVGSSERGDAAVLVADAAANAVLRVERDGSDDPEISVFHAWPTLPDDEEFPEYVPTSLAKDADGNIYVGGLGSEQAGRATVTQFSPDGEVLQEWTGFTGISGVGVDPDGSHLYVSQLFGTTPLLPVGEVPSDEAPPTEGVPGDVVRVDTAAGTYVSEPVPFPAGVAADGHGRTYVAAHSVADADGAEASEAGPGSPGGQVWQIAFGDDEAPLPVTGSPFPPADTGGRFVPAPADYDEFLTVEDCGTTLFVSPGDVRGLELRATEEDDGRVRVEVRGPATVDVRAQDGRAVDEVDASGSIELLAGEDSFTSSFTGPGLWTTFPDEEEQVDAAGLPRSFTFTGGTVTLTYSAEDEAPRLEGLSELEGVTDLCELLG